MKLQINKKTKIKDLQKAFSDAYPYLKIEFYKKPHRERELSSGKDKIFPGEIISELDNFKGRASINIGKDRTVADVEAEFYDKSGIAVQVSRRTGDLWIETSLTDYRTLGMQNQQGEMASSINEDTLTEVEY
jgi:hypothetical protein